MRAGAASRSSKSPCATSPASSSASGSTSRGWPRCSSPAWCSASAGSVRLRAGGASFVVKAHEILAGEGETVHTEGIVPVYPASESISARVLRDLVHAARRAARSVPDPLSGALRAAERLPAKADAILAIHAPRSHPEAAAARDRLVLEELLLMQLGLLLHKHARAGGQQRAGAGPAGRPGQGFPGGAALPPHRSPDAGHRRDRRRPRALNTDATSAAGRRRLRQDRGGRPYPGAGGRERPSGSLHGAYRDARRAAPLDNGGAARAAGPLRAADVAPDGGRAPRGARPHRLGRGGHRGGHARSHPGRRGVCRPRGGGRRRAAPLRSRAARRDAAARRRRRPHAARPLHDGDADSAHAGPDVLRRSRRHRHRRRAGRPHPGRHAPGLRGATIGRLRLRAQAARQGPASLRRLPSDRRIRGAAVGGGDGRSRAPALPASFATTRWACSTAR